MLDVLNIIYFSFANAILAGGLFIGFCLIIFLFFHFIYEIYESFFNQ